MTGNLTSKWPGKSLRCTCLILLVLFLVMCNNKNNSRQEGARPGMDEMADLNRYFVQKDRERIQNYIERKNITMSESPTGLWYQLLKEGEGSFFKDGEKIVMDYTCSLLDGTECYTSKDSGPREIVLGRSELEAGLNEGLRLLKPGGEAIFILPPFLSFGLIGDGKKIPPRAIVVYNVNIQKH